MAEVAEEQSKLIGVKIKKLREKSGIKGYDLAARSGISAQTISRLEKGHTDVSFSTLRRILASMGYSLKDLANQELELENANLQEISYNFLLKKLSGVGIDKNFLTTRIIPSRVHKVLSSRKDQPQLLLNEAASYVSEVYGWNIDDIWTSSKLRVPKEASLSALYKMPANVNINQIEAYSHYSQYIANVVLKATAGLSTKPLPLSTEQFLKDYYNQYATLDLLFLVEFIWSLGIIVLPLNDAGLFHGAAWKIDGRYVIIVKQNSLFHARWIFDLLHELYHVLDHLKDADARSIIEIEEISPVSKTDSMEEREANTFANLVLFNGKAEEHAQKATEIARWNVSNLAAAVKKVATQHKIRIDSLANYVAFRLSTQNQNWWGHATKLQIADPNPYQIVLEKLKGEIKFNSLTPLEENLLKMAIQH